MVLRLVVWLLLLLSRNYIMISVAVKWHIHKRYHFVLELNLLIFISCYLERIHLIILAKYYVISVIQWEGLAILYNLSIYNRSI